MNAPRPWRAVNAQDLAVDPELSALALLDAALAITFEAMLARLPELDPKAHSWSHATPVVLAARQIVVHGRLLRHIIDDYRHHVEHRFPDDDIPF